MNLSAARRHRGFRSAIPWGMGGWIALAVFATFSHAQAQGWPDQRRIGPLLVHSDAPLTETDLAMLGRLAQLEQDLNQALGLGMLREPIYVYIFSERAPYQQYLKEYFPELPYRPALFVKARGPGMVFVHRGANFETDLRHEATHAMLHASLPMVPLWLDEGLAEYFELPREERAYDNPYLATLRWNFRFRVVPGLARLEAIDSVEAMGRSQYRYSWAWVHLLLHGPAPAREELVQYLADIRASTPPGQLSERLARRLDDPDRQLAEHFKRWRR